MFGKGLSIEGADAEVRAVEEGEGGRISPLGEGRAARVQAHRTIGPGGDVWEMGVSLAEEVETSLRLSLFTIDMSVGEKDAASFVHYPSVVGQDREVEEHLVDFAVAIAPHCDDGAGECVEAVGHGRGIQSRRQTVAWPVVEEVTEKEEHLAALVVVVGEEGIEGCDGAVEVRGNQVFHMQTYIV